MIEFETLCYLQNQKTGCTYVETLLRRFCDEDLLRFEKHRPLSRRKPGKFYFINVREPLDAYGSLFRYGLDGRGELFVRLRRAGHEALYQQGQSGFAQWLEFVLDAAHAELVNPAAGPVLSGQLGLQSWRFLRLATLGLDQAAQHLVSPQALRDHAQAQQAVDHVVRYECMNADLRELLTGPLAHAFTDSNSVNGWLDKSPRINASATKATEALSDISQTLRERLVQREWYLYETHYNADGTLNLQKRT
jgi:hypothetical protein